jgi:hypothetical protein
MNVSSLVPFCMMLLCVWVVIAKLATASVLEVIPTTAAYIHPRPQSAYPVTVYHPGLATTLATLGEPNIVLRVLGQCLACSTLYRFALVHGTARADSYRPIFDSDGVVTTTLDAHYVCCMPQYMQCFFLGFISVLLRNNITCPMIAHCACLD